MNYFLQAINHNHQLLQAMNIKINECLRRLKKIEAEDDACEQAQDSWKDHVYSPRGNRIPDMGQCCRKCGSGGDDLFVESKWCNYMYEKVPTGKLICKGCTKHPCGPGLCKCGEE